MRKEEVQTGDNFFIKGSGLISDTICTTMIRWGKQQEYDTSRVYSHAGTFVWIGGELYVFGSIDSGFKPWLFNYHYDWDKDDFMIQRRNIPLSFSDTNLVVHTCMHYVTVSLLYQYWNFIQWLVLVYLHINLFRKGSQDFTYCYNSTKLIRKALNPEKYNDEGLTDIFTLIYDPNYYTLYTSRP
jgi:hypothetical protein